MSITFPQDANIPLYTNAVVKIRSGDYVAAEHLLRQSLQKEGHTALSYYYLAQTISKAKDRQDEALQFQAFALKFAPNHPTFLAALGLRLHDAGREEDALAVLEQSLAVDPNNLIALPWVLRLRRRFMKWTSQEQEDAAIQTLLSSGHPIDPMMLLTFLDCPHTQLKHACLTAPKAAMRQLAARKQNEKIRVGYFSADFTEHATMHLMEGILRCHNKDEFEFFIYDFLPDKKSHQHKLVKEFADTYHDVRALDVKQIVDLARNDQLDIAIDLKGMTRDCRPAIFAVRVAPVQVAFLGFPGTSGMLEMDYMIADAVTLPEEYSKYYSEKIIRFPECYQPTNNRRNLPAEQNIRAKYNLPDDKFVFANFNHPHKVGPREFATWMKILDETPNSVLLFYTGKKNLDEELARLARSYNVDPSRVISCGILPQKEHLERVSQVDLCLDCFSYNAHTTASDALWAGVPLLTLCGKQFSARVAASILAASDIDGLTAFSLGEYVEIAKELANDPQKVEQYKNFIKGKRATSALFNTERWTQNFEALLKLAHQKHLAGNPPDHISLSTGVVAELSR